MREYADGTYEKPVKCYCWSEACDVAVERNRPIFAVVQVEKQFGKVFPSRIVRDVEEACYGCGGAGEIAGEILPTMPCGICLGSGVVRGRGLPEPEEELEPLGPTPAELEDEMAREWERRPTEFEHRISRGSRDTRCSMEGREKQEMGKTLSAENNIHGWYVDDSDGGRWWPDDEAQEEIQRNDDPAARAVALCRDEPMRGEWVS
jgi:hypothetical protein